MEPQDPNLAVGCRQSDIDYDEIIVRRTCPECHEEQPEATFHLCIECNAYLCRECLERCPDCQEYVCYTCSDKDFKCKECSAEHEQDTDEVATDGGKESDAVMGRVATSEALQVKPIAKGL